MSGNVGSVTIQLTMGVDLENGSPAFLAKPAPRSGLAPTASALAHPCVSRRGLATLRAEDHANLNNRNTRQWHNYTKV
jgi:hypothetical protein